MRNDGDTDTVKIIGAFCNFAKSA